ncbi:MAG: hypothetical protein J5767_01095 [Paludibacteraceae bacterium]|nr:hypothetical protein [Paludibacteraceae bacterium]
MNAYINPSENEKIIFVNIRNSYNCKDKFNELYRPNLYEATRKYWIMSLTRASKATLLIGHVNGIVKEVIRPTNCYKSKAPKYTNRVEFEGEEVLDSIYLGKSITNKVKIGQNPVNYLNM